jgi:hypothetical protein
MTKKQNLKLSQFIASQLNYKEDTQPTSFTQVLNLQKTTTLSSKLNPLLGHWGSKISNAVGGNEHTKESISQQHTDAGKPQGN